jgi:quaternary ammonium compound-resistance protein SugE
MSLLNPSIGLAWILLVVAGLLEPVWAGAMKASDGFTKLWPAVLTLASAWSSFVLLGLALKALPVGTAYAVWTGMGAVGTALLGIAMFNEPANAVRLGSITLIIAGIAGLKLAGGE